MSSSLWLFLSVVSSLLSAVFTADTLVLVQLLMRHGDRSPLHIYPTDNNTENTWPQGFCQLSNLGIQQELKLGTFLRKRYVEESKLLSSTYQRKELRVRSTDLDRTLMSATSLLQGLYPAQGNTSTWYPIPVHTKPDPEDALLNMKVSCKKYDDEFSAVMRSEELKNLTEQNKEFIYYVCVKAGFKNATLANVWDIYDPLHIEFAENRSDPRWVNSALMQQVTYLQNKKFEYDLYTDDMKKIRAGVFLTKLHNNTRAKISGDEPSDIKAYLYMAHDTALSAVMSALGIYDNQIPPIASVLFFELYLTEAKEYAVKVLYKNNSVSDPKGPPVTLTLPGCTEMCPIDKFYQNMKPYFIEDADALLAYCEYWGHSTITKGGVVAVSIVCALFLIGLIVLFMWCYRHQQAEVRYSPANFAGDPNP